MNIELSWSGDAMFQSVKAGGLQSPAIVSYDVDTVDTKPGTATKSHCLLYTRDGWIMRLCARIILRIIGDLAHNWASPA